VAAYNFLYKMARKVNQAPSTARSSRMYQAGGKTPSGPIVGKPEGIQKRASRR
jgi:hypothetical protein